MASHSLKFIKCEHKNFGEDLSGSIWRYALY